MKFFNFKQIRAPSLIKYAYVLNALKFTF